MKKIIIAIGFLGLLSGSATAVFAGYFETTPVDSCDTQITHTLQIGSENNDVYVLQNMLSHGGYLFVSPNGYFGPSTKAAVKRFQSENGVPVNGVVGEATRNAVNERLCDADVRGDTSSRDIYGNYTAGVTYVDNYDPYAIVVSPQNTTPAIYATPQENIASFSTSLRNSSDNYSNNYTSVVNSNLNVITPSENQIQNTKIVYSDGTGYTYGITQKTGSITVGSPVAYTIYKEGDTVNVAWSTKNMNATGFQVFIENVSSGQSRQIATTKKTNISFVLSKELLDDICIGQCNESQEGSFKVVISTPVTDIAGITSNFKAVVSPITIKRPYLNKAVVTLTTSKTPVDSGEKFKLYVNTPAVTSWDPSLRDTATVKVHAICINNVQVSIAGVPCGQELVMPLSAILDQQNGIPVTATNTTWYNQDISFETAIMNISGQLVGTAKTNVTINHAPFNW